MKTRGLEDRLKEEGLPPVGNQLDVQVRACGSQRFAQTAEKKFRSVQAVSYTGLSLSDFLSK